MTTRTHDEAMQRELRELRIVWLRYVVRTEEYDRTLPGSWTNHPHHQSPEWLLHSESLRRSRDFARRQRTMVELDAASFGVSLGLSDQIRTWAGALSFGHAKQLLAMLEDERDQVQALPIPPAHLLPLALEALSSSDARQVLGDALQETGWYDWRIRYVFAEVPVPKTKRQGDGKASKDHVHRFATGAPGTGPIGRAIAAVLLFRGWTWGRRWPLVEEHDEAMVALFRKNINAAIEGVINREPHDRF